MRSIATVRRAIHKAIRDADKDFEKHRRRVGSCLSACEVLQARAERVNSLEWVLDLLDRRKKRPDLVSVDR